MLMRRLYQGLGLVLLAFAAFTFVMAIIRLFAGGGIGALVLGVTLGAVVGALGFIVYAFATGPAQRGLHYFVIGDNRSAGGSEDSRVFGPVPLDEFSGRATFVWWPLFTRDAAGNVKLNLRALPRPEGFAKLDRQLADAAR